jgi:hypothetical protein
MKILCVRAAILVCLLSAAGLILLLLEELT